MTQTDALLTDGFDRIKTALYSAVEGLNEQQLTARVGPDANSIGWLAWHIVRVQDSQIADVASIEQQWTADGWFERFGLPFDVEAHGYGQSSDDVAAVKGISGDDFLGYFDAVHAQTLAYVTGLTDDDLERVVDADWNPPVTLSARLVSILADDLQHVGQVAYIKGLLA